jgi:hypothetical protein
MEEMILTGPILIFDKPSINNFMIPKTCKIEFPEKIPVVWDYNFNDPKNVLGFASLEILKDRIVATVTVTNDLFKQLMKEEKRIFCGGSYVGIKSKVNDDGLIIVQEAKLRGLGAYLAGDEFLYLEL